jgi:hypothetical protein
MIEAQALLPAAREGSLGLRKNPAGKSARAPRNEAPVRMTRLNSVPATLVLKAMSESCPQLGRPAVTCLDDSSPRPRALSSTAEGFLSAGDHQRGSGRNLCGRSRSSNRIIPIAREFPDQSHGRDARATRHGGPAWYGRPSRSYEHPLKTRFAPGVRLPSRQIVQSTVGNALKIPAGRKQRQPVFQRMRGYPVIRVRQLHTDRQELRAKATVDCRRIGVRMQDFKRVQKLPRLLERRR